MITVSIVVAIYNHENYLKKAINSILMQQVNFEYEVLIGEDCSTDNSRKILQELEPKLPYSFHIFYREHNYGAADNFNDLYHRMKGKYYIVLEGDDYWTSPNKLQKQVNFLNAHNEYIAVAHNCIVVDEYGNPRNISYPECKKNEYTAREWRKRILPGQTATILMRNYYIDGTISRMKLNLNDFKAGDQVKAFLLLCNGKIWCMQEQLSAYRFVVNKGDSFSAKNKGKVDDNLRFYLAAYEYCIDYNVDQIITRSVENNVFWELLRVYIRNRNDCQYILKDEWDRFHYKASDIFYAFFRILREPRDKFVFIRNRRLQ